jgi:hypothetical protein
MDCETLAEGSALEMIAACFRHQHPEAFGGTPVAGPVLPVDVRYGRDDARELPFTQLMREEAMGHPEAQTL